MSDVLPRHQVRFYLDFVSPHVFLAIARAQNCARANRVDWDLGLDAAGLGERISDNTVKRELHDLTREALDSGIVGVPPFEYEGDIFWGHDRLDRLAARLQGRLVDLGPEMYAMERRPRGATRKGAPDPN